MLKLHLLSVLGIIAIPGMMTGAILGGSSVTQAAKLQMIIMFCISASTALAAMFTTVYAISVVVDEEHRVRPDKIHSQGSGFGAVLVVIKDGSRRLGEKAHKLAVMRSTGNSSGATEEREMLIR